MVFISQFSGLCVADMSAHTANVTDNNGATTLSRKHPVTDSSEDLVTMETDHDQFIGREGERDCPQAFLQSLLSPVTDTGNDVPSLHSAGDSVEYLTRAECPIRREYPTRVECPSIAEYPTRSVQRDEDHNDHGVVASAVHTQLFSSMHPVIIDVQEDSKMAGLTDSRLLSMTAAVFHHNEPFQQCLTTGDRKDRCEKPDFGAGTMHGSSKLSHTFCEAGESNRLPWRVHTPKEDMHSRPINHHCSTAAAVTFLSSSPGRLADQNGTDYVSPTHRYTSPPTRFSLVACPCRPHSTIIPATITPSSRPRLYHEGAVLGETRSCASPFYVDTDTSYSAQRSLSDGKSVSGELSLRLLDSQHVTFCDRRRSRQKYATLSSHRKHDSCPVRHKSRRKPIPTIKNTSSLNPLKASINHDDYIVTYHGVVSSCNEKCIVVDSKCYSSVPIHRFAHGRAVTFVAEGTDRMSDPTRDKHDRSDRRIGPCDIAAWDDSSTDELVQRQDYCLSTSQSADTALSTREWGKIAALDRGWNTSCFSAASPRDTDASVVLDEAMSFA